MVGDMNSIQRLFFLFEIAFVLNILKCNTVDNTDVFRDYENIVWRDTKGKYFLA